MLAYTLMTAPSAQPTRAMLFLHGILGTRANWRGIARRFVEARPSWAAVLVDLREHGDSLGLQPPHTLAVAAGDVAHLEGSLDLPVQGALGHSFGGKVVLQWLHMRQGQPTEAWVVDASPSGHGLGRGATEVGAVLGTLEALPREWPTRAAFVSAVTDAGRSEPLARWLAMNLRRTETGARAFGPRLDVVRALLEDYADTDLWPVVEAPPSGCTLDFVVGGRSAVFSRDDRERLDGIVAHDPSVSVHVIEDAGHWVHVDAPESLLSLLVSRGEPEDGI